jgi:hypothetical protein
MSRNLPRKSEETDEELQAGWPISGPRLVNNITHIMTMSVEIIWAEHVTSMGGVKNWYTLLL